MKISKIYILNFKNIEELNIDFIDNKTLLFGPNGYGKTTIFDAIELALTGTIKRVDSKEYVDGRSSFKKPYFQNNKNEDVVITLQIKNNKDEILNITRKYDKNQRDNNNPKRTFSLFKAKVNLNDEINIDKLHLDTIFEENDIIQPKIDEFLGFYSKNFKIRNIYNLFNYIQQDETDYYFRQKEVDRKKTLDFLLQIEDYVEKKNKLDKYKKILNKSLTNLKNIRSKYVINNVLAIHPYEPLLPRKNIYSFDKEYLNFDDDLSEESLEQKLEELNKIEKFVHSFSPEEYYKEKKREEFEKEIMLNSEVINYILFRKIVNDEVLVQEVMNNYNILSNKKNYSKYLLKNYIERIDLIDEENKKYKKLIAIKNEINKEYSSINLDTLYDCRNVDNHINILIGLIKKYRSLSESKLLNKKELEHIISLRLELHKHKKNEILNDSQCIYCGYDWHSQSDLNAHYNSMTKLLKNNLSDFEQVLVNCKEEMNKIISKLNKNIEEELKKTLILPKKLYEEIKNISQSNNLQQSFKIFESAFTFTPIPFYRDLTYEYYIKCLEEFIDAMNDFMYIPQNYYSNFRLLYNQKEKFEDILIKYNLIDNDFLLKLQIEKEKIPINEISINRKIDNINLVINEIGLNMEFDHTKSKDPQHLFNKYFDNDKEKFRHCSLEKIARKRDYIINNFESQKIDKMIKLDKRIEIISELFNEVDKSTKILKKNIEEYQSEMINVLKLPFFIYSAKILQNYQQGMGVLLTTNTNSNIRFLANSGSDQDIMYQLSSGQIAVISFAFTLALNTSFKIAEDIKILSIDDPIQDMDSLNIYALVDLLRHSLNDYQIIMSTYNDTNAMFIKYKFDLFNSNDKVNLINIKRLLLDD